MINCGESAETLSHAHISLSALVRRPELRRVGREKERRRNRRRENIDPELIRNTIPISPQEKGPKRFSFNRPAEQPQPFRLSGRMN